MGWDDYRCGFRGNYSTETCLIHLQDLIKTESSKGNLTGMVLIDVKKAFDSVNHNILCKKLELIGANANTLSWFKSYLSDRKQIVDINGIFSEPMAINCGVPQGSILGPTLFLCYINITEC